MLSIILLATIVPILAGVAYITLRNRLPQQVADIRGIALQTVIVIVVLLGIAGAVAGVLISRGDQAVTDLKRQDTDIADQYTTEEACDAAGFTWTAGYYASQRAEICCTLGESAEKSRLDSQAGE